MATRREQVPKNAPPDRAERIGPPSLREWNTAAKCTADAIDRLMAALEKQLVTMDTAAAAFLVRAEAEALKRLRGRLSRLEQAEADR